MLYKYELFLTLQVHFKAVRSIWNKNGKYLHNWELIINKFNLIILIDIIILFLVK